jgi:hypothetical protein
MLPISSEAAANMPNSRRKAAEIGTPTTSSRRSRVQSARQNRPSTWNFLKGRRA